MDTRGLLQQFIEWVIHHGGFYMLLLIVFAETGLFVGFLLPGDSLLFASGIYIADLSKDIFNIHYLVLIAMVIVVSVLGNMVGFWFGNKTGNLLYKKKDNFFYKKKYLLQAQTFYQQYGRSTIFLAKFLPFLRTFAPILAGIIKMDRRVFMFYNILGSTVWVGSMMLSGYFLQGWIFEKFNFNLKDHIEEITIGIIIVSSFPVIYKLLIQKIKHKA